jgi:acyl dehydratase
VTPDKYLPHRYAGASGDFNPIHIDPEFARQVGLPGTEQELVVSGTVKAADGDRVVVDTVAAQGENQVIRNAEAEIQVS